MRKTGPTWLGSGLSMGRPGQGRGSRQGEEVRTLWLDLYTQKPVQDLELFLLDLCGQHPPELDSQSG